MKILIFSSNWIFREGIINFINTQSSCEVFGEEINKETDLINRTLLFQPDVVLLDIDNLGEGDFGTIKHLCQVSSSISVIILSSEYSEDKVITALSNGAKGYLSKTMSKSNLLASLKALQNGELILPRRMVNTVLSEFVEISKENGYKKNQLLSNLTYRELEVLNCIKNHETNKEIAIKLMISVNTVRIHVQNILKKLHVQNRREAAKIANQLGHFV